VSPVRRAVLALQAVILAASLAGAVLTSRAADWHPLGLVILLAILAVTSDALAIEARGQQLSGSFIALVLAMALLGPAPACAMGLGAILADTVRRRPAVIYVFINLATYAAFPLVGGLMIRAIAGHPTPSIEFGLAVLAVFATTNFLNFALIALARRFAIGHSLTQQFQQIFVPVLPSEALAAVLAVAIALVSESVGLPAMAALALVLFIFQVLARELLLSRVRAEELELRTEQLGALQVGVLATLIQTLALRDKMTARHSAAVARYTKSIAEELGLDEEQQDLAHTAGLLHDIGKFIFPDNILFADRKLTDADWEIVKKHPAQGARLVRRVDGYGPVADIILAHHERMDGSGYPSGLPADRIPMISRMISVADTFDVMTARDSYRRPVPRADAIAELRRVSGTQLDGEVVEAFVRLLERKDVAFQHTSDADFERELGFQARVARFARRKAA
jgi:putative nucleotidyltransferase with HDIG domain